MPLYSFIKVDDPEVEEDFFFTMKEAPKVDEIITDDDGVKWKRIFTLPFAGVDTQINPDSVNDFVEKTGKKKGTLGNIFDASKELSEKRAKQRGEDPVQKKFFENYKKQRFGVKHLEELRKAKVDKKGFTISYD
jgi:hypothetical protein